MRAPGSPPTSPPFEAVRTLNLPGGGRVRLLGHFLVRSQLLMALSAAAFVWICAEMLGRRLPAPWYLLAAVGCWWVYLADAGFAPSQEDRLNVPERVRFLERHRQRLVLMAALLTGGAALWLARVAPPQGRTVVLLGVLGLVAAAYAFPLVRLPGGARRRLKEFDLLKPVIISVAWLAGGTLLPLIEGRAGAAPPVPAGAAISFLGLLLMGDSIALDWRDRAGDHRQGIRTLAVRLGPAISLVLLAEIIGAGALWWFASPASVWHGLAGSMLLAHALSLATFPLAGRYPLFFYSGVAAWRFVGALVLALSR